MDGKESFIHINIPRDILTRTHTRWNYVNMAIINTHQLKIDRKSKREKQSSLSHNQLLLWMIRSSVCDERVRDFRSSFAWKKRIQAAHTNHTQSQSTIGFSFFEYTFQFKWGHRPNKMHFTHSQTDFDMK